MTSEVKPVDVYDKQGNLTHIEFLDVTNDKFMFDAIWDPRDPQDNEHRKLFREWACHMASQLGFKVVTL